MASTRLFRNVSNHPRQSGLKVAAWLLLALSAHAQPAAGTATPAPANQPAGGEEIQPSRYVGQDPSAYIAKLSSRFSIRSRTTDPFGQQQDPAAKPVRPAAPKAITPQAAASSKPFADIVSRIRVTTVMPAERRFLIGTRSIAQGDSLPLVSNGTRYQIRVAEVSSRKIVFKNMETGETGELPLDVLPPGMERGTQGILAPGMQAARPDAPLEIDSPPAAGSRRGR
jgi:hypothetical protein